MPDRPCFIDAPDHRHKGCVILPHSRQSGGRPLPLTRSLKPDALSQHGSCELSNAQHRIGEDDMDDLKKIRKLALCALFASGVATGVEAQSLGVSLGGVSVGADLDTSDGANAGASVSIGGTSVSGDVNVGSGGSGGTQSAARRP